MIGRVPADPSEDDWRQLENALNGARAALRTTYQWLVGERLHLRELEAAMLAFIGINRHVRPLGLFRNSNVKEPPSKI